MKKPRIRTRQYLDWVEIRPYLTSKYPELKLEKALGLLADRGNFHNGCFVSLEDREDMYEPEVEALAKAVFKEWPQAVDKYNAIELWIWW